MTSFSAIHPRRFHADLHVAPTAAVAAAGVASVVLAATLVMAHAPAPDRAARTVLAVLLAGVPIGVGLSAARSAQSARFGWLLASVGAVWAVSSLAESPDSLPYSIGRIVVWLITPLLVYVTLAYPVGRIVARRDRRLYGGAALAIAVLAIGSAPFVEAYPQPSPWASCGAVCPQNAFMVLGHEPAVMANVIVPARELLTVLLLIAVCASLGRRVRKAPLFRRLTDVPVLVMTGLATILLAEFYLARRFGAAPATVDTFGLLWAFSVPGVAAAFGLGLMWHRLQTVDVVERLSKDLGEAPQRRHLQRAVATALGDPTVELRFPDGPAGRWRDPRGRLISMKAPLAPGRAVREIGDDGAPLAAIEHDAALSMDDELIDVVGALVLSALRQERLTDRLATSLSQLEESRKRIATVADLERSRIERDLHDGAQQRLVLLRIRLSIVEDTVSTDPGAVAGALAELGTEVDEALDELRSLAHGVYPAVLSDRGLKDALHSVAMHSAAGIAFSARGVRRLPREIETAVYFTCVEALQNAYKHAPGARTTWLSLRQDRALTFEVGDDGPGFTPPGGSATGGLRNMQDRIEAIGGTLSIDSVPGHGTRVCGSVPLD